MSEEHIDAKVCPFHRELGARLDGVSTAMDTLAKNISSATAKLETRVEYVYNAYHNRLPIWATVVFMALVGLCGWLLKAALEAH